MHKHLHRSMRVIISFAALAIALLCIAPASGEGDKTPTRDWELVRSVGSSPGGTKDFVLIPEAKQRDLRYHEEIASDVCASRNTCFVFFWTNRNHIPHSESMPVADLSFMTATYERHPSYEKPVLRLACWLYPTGAEAKHANCFVMPGAKVPEGMSSLAPQRTSADFASTSQTTIKPASLNQKPLNDVPLDFGGLQQEQTHKYKWFTVTDNGKGKSEDYALLVISSRLEKGGLLLHDKITLAPAYEGTVFERTTKYPKGDLLHPEQITLDIIGDGKSVREMSYEKGEMRIKNDSGGTNIEHPKFNNGILTFNALLRLAPLLPRDIGKAYAFQMYAEPFLFRIREAKEKNDSFTIASETSETVKIGTKPYKCVKFRLQLESSRIREDIWVGDNNLVVKFVDSSMDMDRDPYYLEANLQE